MKTTCEETCRNYKPGEHAAHCSHNMVKRLLAEIEVHKREIEVRERELREIENKK